MTKPKLLRSLLATALLGAALSASAVTFVDTFNAPQATVVNDSTADLVDGPADSFGLFANSTRRMSLINIANEAPLDARSRMSIQGGQLTFSNDAEVTSEGYLTYDFLSPVDLTGSETFNVNLLSNDVAGKLYFSALDYNGNSGGYFEYDMPASTSPFSVSVTNAFAGVDKTQLRGIAFVFTAYQPLLGELPGQDLQVASIQAVPEPASMAALGLGAAGLLRRRKRA